MTAQQSLACTDERRRRRVRREGLNGIDAIDISTNRHVLTVTFLDVAPANLTRANVRIEGGTRITGDCEVIRCLPPYGARSIFPA